MRETHRKPGKLAVPRGIGNDVMYPIEGME